METTDNQNYPANTPKTCNNFLTFIFSKNYFKAFVFLLTISFSGCADDDKQDDEVPGEKYTLVVHNGTGSGTYSEGETVSIIANTPEEDQVFAQWEGDSEVLSYVTSSETTFEMPAQDIELTATYEESEPVDPGDLVSISVNRSVDYQVIDGFGFFGAQDVWWGSASDMWSQDWGEKVITDLGLSIFRNEYYPPAIPGANQDADWDKQKPVVEGLKQIADANQVDLKFIFTVWSPPADLKWVSDFDWPGDEDATRGPGDVTTKYGGTLNPEKYSEFADWIKDGIALYSDAGIDLYGLSLQNEPAFSQYFNSCTYTVQWYADLLKNVVPEIKTDYPDIQIFGSENMLDMEGADINWPYFYHSGIKADEEAAVNLDIFAVHGYNDGVAPTSGSGLAERWTNHLNEFSEPLNKPTWMTETSGYVDDWNGAGDAPGALSLAQDIHAALYYGNASAWVWWQGSDLDGIDEYSLMSGTETGKKYAVSKHFYRYIRPGAVRVMATTEQETIFITAYEHTENDTFTIILINSGDEDKMVFIEGDNLPEAFIMYRTTAGEDNCSLIGEVNFGQDNAFNIPANSVVTLQAGGDPL